MRLLACGDRDWVKVGVIRRVLIQAGVGPGTTLIHGDARGADRMARDVGQALGATIEAYPADWARYKRAAGPIRNQQMLVEGKPDRVIAFHADIANSKGTKDMVERARAAGLPVTVVTGEDEPEPRAATDPNTWGKIGDPRYMQPGETLDEVLKRRG